MDKKAYAFLGYKSTKPLKYRETIPKTNGKFAPVNFLKQIKLLEGDDFKFKRKTINGTKTAYLKYKGKSRTLFYINLNITLDMISVTSQPATYRIAIYKGSKGKFPDTIVPSITTSYDLSPRLIYNASANGLIWLDPGDTVTYFYSNTEAIPENSLLIFDYEIVLFAIKNCEAIRE